MSGIVEGETAYQETLTSVCDGVIEQMNERFVGLLKNPILKAACVFEHARWPSYETALT